MSEQPSGVCQQCGATFHPSNRESLVGFARRKFCSQVCNGAAKRARHAVPEKACEQCGKPVVRRRGESSAALANRKHCSRPCLDKARRERPKAPRTPKPKVEKPKPALTVFGDRPPAQPWRPAGFAPAPAVRRGTTNRNARGNSYDRAARRRFLLDTFGDGQTCPCYRCGVALDEDSLTVDRIVPGRDGGRYVRGNIRPACGTCNSVTGGALARKDAS